MFCLTACRLVLQHCVVVRLSHSCLYLLVVRMVLPVNCIAKLLIHWMIGWLVVVMLSLPRTQGSHDQVTEYHTWFCVMFICRGYLDITVVQAVEFFALRYLNDFILFYMFLGEYGIGRFHVWNVVRMDCLSQCFPDLFLLIPKIHKWQVWWSLPLVFRNFSAL